MVSLFSPEVIRDEKFRRIQVERGRTAQNAARRQQWRIVRCGELQEIGPAQATVKPYATTEDNTGNAG